MKIILPIESGFKAVGEYQAGQVYDVDDNEAKRLINVKGFRAATGKDVSESVKLDNKDKAAPLDA